jgi:hypothetical protein
MIAEQRKTGESVIESEATGPSFAAVTLRTVGNKARSVRVVLGVAIIAFCR